MVQVRGQKSGRRSAIVVAVRHFLDRVYRVCRFSFGVALVGLALSACSGGGGGGGGTTTSTDTGAGTVSSAATATATGTATGTVRTAASPKLADVQAAFNAASTGDTVIIPAGSAEWVAPGQLVVAKRGIEIRGTSSAETTIFRTGSTVWSNYLIKVTAPGVRLSNLHIVGNLGNGATDVDHQDTGVGFIEQGAVDFQIHDCVFENSGAAAVAVGYSDPHRGVIFNNRFLNNYNAQLQNLGYGVLVIGGGTWPDLALGTAEAVFVEDNEFVGSRHDIASNNGSRYVFRHNKTTVTDVAKGYAMIDSHGYSSSQRGSRSYEIYENSMYTNSDLKSLAYALIGIRGGDGVVWNNHIMSAMVGRIMVLTVEGFTCGTYPGVDQTRSLYYWGNTEVDQSGTSDEFGIINSCPSSVALNRDYFTTPKPGYTPYPYPHPARVSN